MRVLFIGGTGIISTACTRLAAQRGIDLTVLTRGRRSADLPPGVHTLGADIEDPARRRALASHLSTPSSTGSPTPRPTSSATSPVPRPHPPIRLHQLRQRLSEARDGLSHHRIHASRQPVLAVLPRQDRLRRTPHAGLARRRLPHHHRPPLAHLWRHPIPLAVNSWPSPTPSSTVCAAARRSSSPATAPHSGPSPTTAISPRASSACSATQQAIGHAFHITTDEVLTWDQFYRIVRRRPPAPSRRSSTSPPISSPPACPTSSAASPATRPPASSSTTPRSSASSPAICATVPFAEGIRRTIAWFDADPARQQIDTANAAWDKLIDAWHCATGDALRRFQS